MFHPKAQLQSQKLSKNTLVKIMNAEMKSLKGVTSLGGSIFRTICEDCNSKRIGANDNEVSRIYLELTQRIKNEFKKYDGTPNTLFIKADVLKYCRAMIGHILAATSVKECQREPVRTPYFSPLQDFVLGDDTALSNSHDIYYWFYPHKRHLSAKMVLFHNKGNNCCLSLLSFFPLAFLVTEKGKGIYPAHATKLNLNDSKLTINLSQHNSKYIDFPFCKLTEQSMYMLVNSQCIVSYPIN